MLTKITAGLALAAMLGLSGCTTSGADEQTKNTAPDAYVGGKRSLTQVPPAARKAAPSASGPALGSNKTISDADFAGKVVVLNVWGSWCSPCRGEAAALEQASRETADEAQFLGIDSRDTDPAPAKAFVRAFNITYPSIYDPDGSVLLNFAGDLPLSTFPSTLVIDKQGRIAARITGPISQVTLVDLIDDVAAGK
jgi:thiol-disulfide isomerase/thioredoxin